LPLLKFQPSYDYIQQQKQKHKSNKLDYFENSTWLKIDIQYCIVQTRRNYSFVENAISSLPATCALTVIQMSYKYFLPKFVFQTLGVSYGLQNTEHSKKCYYKMNKAKIATLTKSLPTAGPQNSQDVPGLEPAGQYVLFHHC